MKNTINKRVHFSYVDEKKGYSTGHIDVDMDMEDEGISDSKLKKLVKRKWDKLKYTRGFIDTVQIESIQ